MHLSWPSQELLVKCDIVLLLRLVGRGSDLHAYWYCGAHPMLFPMG